MKEIDNNILDQLFEKARAEDAVISVNEIKASLNTPKPQASFFAKHWTYISLTCAIAVVVFISTYKDLPKKEEKHKPFIPMQENRTLLGKQEVTKQGEQISITVKTEKRMTLENQNAVTSITPDTLTQNDSSVALLTNTTSSSIDSLKKEPEPRPASPETKNFGIVIHKFSNMESIKLYQKRLAESGIRLEIIEIEYDKKYPDNITQLAADLFIQNTFYKSINISDFKELRIQWETESSGTTKIQSVSMLDKFYMLKML